MISVIGKKGFLLIDVFLALAILSVGLLVSIHAFNITNRSLKKTDINKNLALCAEQKLMSFYLKKDFSPLSCKTFSWKEMQESHSIDLNRVTLKALWNDQEKEHEHIFETILPVQ